MYLSDRKEKKMEKKKNLSMLLSYEPVSNLTKYETLAITTLY